MPINRTNWIDDDGSGTTGTVINNAEKTLLYDQIDAALVTTATGAAPGYSVITTTGTIATLPLPSGAGPAVIIMNNAAPATIQGIAVPATPYRSVTIVAHNAPVLLGHQVTGDSRMMWNYATSAPTPLAATGTVTYVWDQTVSGIWRMVAHEQGAWITPPFNAGNFVGVGGTWTVAAGNVTTYAYRLSGRTLQINFHIGPTSVSVALPTLKVTIPGGFVLAQTAMVPANVLANAANWSTGSLGTLINGNTMDLSPTSGSFVTGGATYVAATLAIAVN